MSPNVESEIAEIKEKVEENNKILKKMRTAGRWSLLFGILRWIIYIGLIAGTYSLIKPYIDETIKAYNTIQETAGAMSNAKNQPSTINLDSLKNFIK